MTNRRVNPSVCSTKRSELSNRTSASRRSTRSLHTFHAVIVSNSRDCASKFLRFRREKRGVGRAARATRTQRVPRATARVRRFARAARAAHLANHSGKQAIFARAKKIRQLSPSARESRSSLHAERFSPRSTYKKNFEKNTSALPAARDFGALDSRELCCGAIISAIRHLSALLLESGPGASPSLTQRATRASVSRR